MNKLRLYNAVKTTILTFAIIFTFAACKRSADERPIPKETKEHADCVTFTQDNDACGPYRVLSYEVKKTDIGWTAYEFVLERFGVRIVADCPESRCSHWVNSVGKVV